MIALIVCYIDELVAMKKVALCISGKIGNTSGKTGFKKSDPKVLIKAYEHYKRHIIDKNDVDVFIHCWDTELSSQIKDLYKPKKAVIEPQKFFKVPRYVKASERPWQFKSKRIRRQSIYSRWYSNKIVNLLRNEYEIDNGIVYDFVMTTRFDIAFEKDIIFSDLDNEYFYAGNWSVVKNKEGKDLFNGGRGELYDLVKGNKEILKELEIKNYGYESNQTSLLDLWFISNSIQSTKFFNLFDYLDEYLRPGNCPLSQDRQRIISPHLLCVYHLKQIKLDKKIRFKYNMYDDFPLVRRKYYGERQIETIRREPRLDRLIRFLKKIKYKLINILN